MNQVFASMKTYLVNVSGLWSTTLCIIYLNQRPNFRKKRIVVKAPLSIIGQNADVPFLLVLHWIVSSWKELSLLSNLPKYRGIDGSSLPSFPQWDIVAKIWVFVIGTSLEMMKRPQGHQTDTIHRSYRHGVHSRIFTSNISSLWLFMPVVIHA